MTKPSKHPKRSRLWFYFSCLVFGSLVLMFVLFTVIWVVHYRLMGLPDVNIRRHFPLVSLLLGCIFLGSVISFFVGHRIIHPLLEISSAFAALSEGDFSVRVSEKSGLVEIREMARNFNSMVYDLSHIETLRSDFVVNVSHEFKTPIAAIEGYATLLQDTALSPEKHSFYVEKILANSRRLSTLSTNVLTLSKLENQETVLHRKEYRLDEQIRRAILLLEPQWSKKNIEFDIDMPNRMFYGNEQLLDQVWFNLIDNAIKHSANDSTIGVQLSGIDPVTVRITDHGEGMTPEVQKHIFEKFYQGDHSRTSEGNGLGLALVKRIMDLCGGTVDVKSAPKEGSTFTVSLTTRTSAH